MPKKKKEQTPKPKLDPWEEEDQQEEQRCQEALKDWYSSQASARRKINFWGEIAWSILENIRID